MLPPECGWNYDKCSSASILKLVKPLKSRISNIYNRIFKALYATDATISHSYTVKHASDKEQRWYLAKSAQFGIILEPADPKLAYNCVLGKSWGEEQMEWIRKWRINGDQIGRDRKCWPLQSLQTKRICEARTSSLFLLKEEPVSTFLGAEKLALALPVTSAVFERRSGAPYPGEGYVLGISSSRLSVSLPLTLLRPGPPQPADPLILCQYVWPSPPLSLHFTILSLPPSRCFKARTILSVSPLLPILTNHLLQLPDGMLLTFGCCTQIYVHVLLV